MQNNIDTIIARLVKFRTDRDWEKYHTPKNLSMALMVEVAEIQELMQWGDPEWDDFGSLASDLDYEIADCLIYLLNMAELRGYDGAGLLELVNWKIDRNERKHPVEGSE